MTPAKAQENLNEFRSLIASSFQESSFHSAYCFNFKFRHMPRRGAETECFGSIAGPTLGSGVFRIEIFPDPVISEQKVFLIRNPLEPRAWVGHQNQNIPKVLSHNALLQPMISGMNQTLFDFLMPFVFWKGEYLKSGKVAGRPSHLYEFASPSWVTETMPDWNRVVLALDDAYQAPLRVEVFSDTAQLLRSTTLRTYKKIGEEWIIKALDCSNQKDRSNTRLEILAAATKLDLNPNFFSEQKFMLPLPIPSSAFQTFD